MEIFIYSMNNSIHNGQLVCFKQCWLAISFIKVVIPLDVLTEIYISREVWDKIRQLDENAELHADTIYLLDCELSVKLISDGSGRYLLKLI